MKSLEKQLKHIKVDEISFDPHNPRGEKEHMIVSDKEFSKLVTSIKNHGLLEPLIVKKDETKEGYYILIDGERRLRAVKNIAKESKVNDTVPALLAKDDMDGRILAYQVHMLRKNWNKAAETISIKKIIEDIRKNKPSITDTELKNIIKNFTAHKDHELNDLLKLCKYDNDIIGKVTSNELDMSYLIQIESNFISPVKRKYPDLIDKYGEENIRKILVQKALDGLLKNTRFLMDKFKNVFNEKEKKGKIKALITDFLNDRDKSIQDTYKEYSESFGQLQKPIIKELKGAAKKKVRVEHVSHYKKIAITKKQQTSLIDIQNKIENIANEFTKDEYEYISEALYCLKMYCFKAAILMVWATGVSRILKFIDKNINDFNNCSVKMKNQPKNIYKNYAKQFKDSFTDIDEVQTQAKDTQLLSFLYYKSITSIPQFKKLKNILDMRNDCGHPTSIELSLNEALVAFENIYSLILNNRKLK